MSQRPASSRPPRFDRPNRAQGQGGASASTVAPPVLTEAAPAAAVVMLAHHPVAFLALCLLFLGFTQAYARHQSALIPEAALPVGFFLADLVVAAAAFLPL